MIDLLDIPKISNLIDDSLSEQLKGIFSRLQAPVVMKAVVALDNEKDLELAVFLHAITDLSEKLTLELYTPDEAGTQVPELNTKWLPVTGFYRDGNYGRVAFHGIPGGREINSFVLALCNLSGPGQEVLPKLMKKIEKLKKTVNIKICVSLSCHHCAAVVTNCQRLAILNSGVEAEMIDATLYPDLVEQYHISRVPMMIVNDKNIHMGNKSMEEIIDLLKY